ncbi:phBC6A51 family helix-turn-helix protein [Neobacillus sp. YX16]|uniref:phBC6A51 family helix-turn-helix protein n=1 Tax=Neobacillus sp. YX16 TaxID=3047874 RepID=UPI0024C2EB5F|nr:phBC6A51 family helix-turn-helix protein [Neobacillus sp. YX16]WHZ05856.1 phBC6A51 family helix-turn-helix protein [Neobacillus sp. YX16]
MSEILRKNSLTDTQKRVAETFATNDIQKKTIAQIAEEYGVTERTIYRWKKDPEFIAYQNSVAERAMEDFLTEAYSKLKQLLREGKSEKTQLEAIKLVLQNRGKLKDSHEHTHEIKQQQTLQDLEREVIDMENELLND